MRIVHSRRPLALVSPFREFALTRATLSHSQADLVLFLITKRVREPIFPLFDGLPTFFSSVNGFSTSSAIIAFWLLVRCRLLGLRLTTNATNNPFPSHSLN